MDTITILPQKIGGTLIMPPSKSMSHRMVICAALAAGTSTIRNVLLSEDIAATCEAMTALGAVIDIMNEPRGLSTLRVTGIEAVDASHQTICCNESGSTLRFMVPILAIKAKKTRITGKGRLPKRPMGPYEDCLTRQGILWHSEKVGQTLPLVLDGCLKPGRFTLPGDVSSQFITGLLLALPLLSGDSEIVLSSPLESRPYVAMTLEAMAAFGVTIHEKNDRLFQITGNQRYCSQDCRVEGDYSQAAFWMAAGCLSEKVMCAGLKCPSSQGDQAIIPFLRKMGGRIARTGSGFLVIPEKTRGIRMDVSQCPDLVPVLAVVAALSEGTSRIVNAGRLRLKESDRLSAITTGLNTLGARITEKRDGLEIHGVSRLKGGTVDSFNDHRIAMALAVASPCCTEPVVLTGPECVKKSYPDFWKDFTRMGGSIQ
ncbi:MAG: 3-phosphoshikimate 1-carboxyvinyltransferase [Eubacteriaceae bacterium]|nr:3-phosphoshikimate 1-carboxyvinyltransferase [Eubacteriaceae bacterium]